MKRRLLGNHFHQSMPIVECTRTSTSRQAGSVHPLHGAGNFLEPKERTQEQQPEVAMRYCIRIALTDDLEFLKCLRIIEEDLCLDAQEFQVKEHHPDSAVFCFCEAECAKLFSLYYALDNTSEL